MGSDQSGIIQSPFGNPIVPTPDSSGGWAGTPGGLDQGSSGSGIVSSPWDDKPVPTDDGKEDASPNIGTTIRQTPIGDSTYEGYQPLGDISKTSPATDVSVK